MKKIIPAAALAVTALVTVGASSPASADDTLPVPSAVTVDWVVLTAALAPDSVRAPLKVTRTQTALVAVVIITGLFVDPVIVID
jgi:hypothetical protein